MSNKQLMWCRPVAVVSDTVRRRRADVGPDSVFTAVFTKLIVV